MKIVENLKAIVRTCGAVLVAESVMVAIGARQGVSPNNAWLIGLLGLMCIVVSCFTIVKTPRQPDAMKR